MALPRSTKRRLGSLLVANGFITEEQVQHALDEQKRTGKPLGQILVELDYISEEELVKALVEQLQVPYIDPLIYNIEPELMKTIPADLMHQYQFVPLDRFDNIIIIAAAGMPDERLVSFFKEALNCDVMLYISTYAAIRTLLQRYIPLTKEQQEAVIEKRKSDALRISERIRAESSARMQKARLTETPPVEEPLSEESVPVVANGVNVAPPPRVAVVEDETVAGELPVSDGDSDGVDWQRLFDEMDEKIREEVKKRKDLRKKGLL